MLECILQVTYDVSALKTLLYTTGSTNGETNLLTQHLDYSLTKSLSVSHIRNLPEARDSGYVECSANKSKRLVTFAFYLIHEKS